MGRNDYDWRPPEDSGDTKDWTNVLALVKGDERYVFLFDDASRAETIRTMGRFAKNPELSFTGYDSAVLSQKIRQEAKKSGEDDF